MDETGRHRLSQPVLGQGVPGSSDARVFLPPNGRARRAVLAGLVGSAFSVGCPGSNSTGPSPSPTPSVPNPLPAGVPNGTAFANLALVHGLALRARPGAILGQVDSARVDLSGRATSLWFYNFFYQGADGTLRLDGWRVWADGRIEYEAAILVSIRLEVGNLDGFLRVDSDRAVSTSLAQGGQACIDRFPPQAWYNSVQYSYLVGVPTVRISLFQPGGAGASDVYLDPVDGSLKARFMSCPS